MENMLTVKIGDFVYVETTSADPYEICKIDHMHKTPKGSVEATVKCYYRRRDLSQSFLEHADSHPSSSFFCAQPEDYAGDVPSNAQESLRAKAKHLLKHRQLFAAQDNVKKLPATHIRGKCFAHPVPAESESLMSKLKEDTFYYRDIDTEGKKMVLSHAKTPRVGSEYQAEIPDRLQEGESCERDLSQLETLEWSARQCNLTDGQINQFTVITKSVDAFSRIVDRTRSVRIEADHNSNNEATHLHVIGTLHKYGYDFSKAVSSLVPSSQPTQCRGPMDEWSASDEIEFEKAFDKYGKNFNTICQESLPQKSMKNIIMHYYKQKWRTNYHKQHREGRVRDSINRWQPSPIPTFNKPCLAQITNITAKDKISCTGCNITQSIQWYSWGPKHFQGRLCAQCWVYWKKFGGLKAPALVNSPLLTQMATQKGVLKCEECKKEFRRKSRLAKHLAAAHHLTTAPVSSRDPVLLHAYKKQLAEKRPIRKLAERWHLKETWANLGWDKYLINNSDSSNSSVLCPSPDTPKPAIRRKRSFNWSKKARRLLRVL